MSDQQEQRSNVINMFEARHRLLMRRIDKEREELRSLPKTFQGSIFAPRPPAPTSRNEKLEAALRRNGSFSGKAHTDRFKNKHPQAAENISQNDWVGQEVEDDGFFSG